MGYKVGDEVLATVDRNWIGVRKNEQINIT